MDATFLTFPLVMIVLVVIGLVVYKKAPEPPPHSGPLDSRFVTWPRIS